MKKYLNKGLLFSWFNSAKPAIIIGLFIWGFIAHKIIQSNLEQVKNQIADDFSNDLYTTMLPEYLMLGVIFIAVFFISKGINKRNTEMFLSSSPYTKKQIKYNELICLLITLLSFVVTYAYIAFMAYIWNREFLTIVEGYQSIIFIETAKIILLGIIGIIFMLIIDCMFSNSIVGFISMISIIPISIGLILVKFIMILAYFGIEKDRSLLSIIDEIFSKPGIYGGYEHVRSILLEHTSVRNVTFKQLSIEIIITISVILIMFIVFNISQNKYKLELSNKIFSSKTNENIIVVLVAAALGSFASLLLLSKVISNMQLKNTGEYLPLTGLNLVKGLGADLLCIAIVGIIACKIMKKVLKALV